MNRYHIPILALILGVVTILFAALLMCFVESKQGREIEKITIRPGDEAKGNSGGGDNKKDK